jgi:hypothetical protein
VRVNAAPVLAEIAQALHRAGLEAVLIGNAAAALQGAPVTTVDFDFLFRKTAVSLKKLKSVAVALRGVILRPYYPASDLYRIVRDDDGLQVDFMATVHGLRSFEGVRDRATTVEMTGAPLRIASLADITKSKPAAGRPRDLAVLEILDWPVKKKPVSRRARLAAVARENRRNLLDLVRRWQALPMEKRTNFLRKRVGPRSTAL